MNRQQIAINVGKLISTTRNATHGDPHKQFWMAQTIKGVLAEGANWAAWNKTEREAIEMIVTKLSRAACGSSIGDHFKDIAGYALIAAESLEPKAKRK